MADFAPFHLLFRNFVCLLLAIHTKRELKMYLELIDQPAQLRQLQENQLQAVANEVREAVLFRVSHHGGHVGPNLGATEATVAMHYVFNTPEDKIVFDVSHQSYPHKVLTGRLKGFTNLEDMNSVSGYSSPLESPVYDNFEIGHTSTSIALCTGLQKARDILGQTHNIVAFIGDGSLGGGEAFEGLNTAAAIGTNIIIVVNDNEMSIAENHGGLYQHLALLRQTQGQSEQNFFKALGFDYHYLEQGNDVMALVEMFRKVKNTPRPTVVHIHTEKGHGYAPATANKEPWHYSAPFDLETGQLLNNGGGEYAPYMLGRVIMEEMKTDPKLVAISAGVPMALGFGPNERQVMGLRHIDVGIAEEEAVALASGMAKGGTRPVFSTFATFLQRTYDQLAQDLCVNGNPAVINVLGSTIYGMNDFTHICFFDIPMFSHIPNLVYLAPTNFEELVAMERWAIRQEQWPVAIRVPGGPVQHASEPCDDDYSQLNTFKMVRPGADVAIIGVGNFLKKAEEVATLLTQKGIKPSVINPRFVSGVDTQMLNELMADHSLVVTLEDGSLDGGFGERIARYYGTTEMRVMCRGVEKALYDRYDVEQLLTDSRLQNQQIVDDIVKALIG